jgi:putative oxidoreductase
MLVAALLLWPFAAGFEGGRPPLTIGAAAALCYVSPIATAFAYWAAVEIGRSVRATTMSMSLLAVPALGTLLSSIVLHEVISLSLLSGLGLIVAGICLVTARFSPRSFNRTTIDWSALVLRAIVGVGFMAHGYAKVSRGPDAFAGILQALDVPLPLVMAWATILVELVGGFAILIGAYVRLASVPMAIVLLVAMFTVHLPYGFSSIKLVAVTSAGPQFGPPGYEVNLLYLACLAALVLGGSRRPRTSTQGR